MRALTKKFYGVAAILLLIFVSTIQINAMSIMPMYVNASGVECNLSLNGSTSTSSMHITGISGTTKISSSISLQKKTSDNTYSTVKTWTETVDSDIQIVSKNFVVEYGNTYRVSLTTSITRNGSTEKITTHSKDVYYGN